MYFRITSTIFNQRYSIISVTPVHVPTISNGRREQEVCKVYVKSLVHSDWHLAFVSKFSYFPFFHEIGLHSVDKACLSCQLLYPPHVAQCLAQRGKFIYANK